MCKMSLTGTVRELAFHWTVQGEADMSRDFEILKENYLVLE